MSYERGVAINGFPFGLIDKNTGSAVTTGVTSGWIVKDGGTQQPLAGVPVHEGNGQWSVGLSASEMDAIMVGLLFTNPSAIPVPFTINTVEEFGGSVITGISTLAGGVSVYGSIVGGNTYFLQRLDTQAWDDASINERNAALIMATRAIDRLNYAGMKADETQALQFPRENDIIVPLDIEIATYECALQFLDGFNIEEETRSIGVVNNRFSGAGSTYDPSYVNLHIRNGIPSVIAWSYLQPYLRDHELFTLSRV